MSPRRSYDQYCSAARALDAVGDRWTLLIVRELLAGPRRYTDLHADLPGVSTDVLASRLKDMERDGLATRRRLPPPGAASCTNSPRADAELLPVLQALGEWGAPALGERRPTDAVRAHWFALPLLRVLEGAGPGEGLVEVRLEEGGSTCRSAPRTADGAVYGDGPGARRTRRAAHAGRVDGDGAGEGDLALRAAVAAGTVVVEGDAPVAKALRGV